MRIAFVAEVFLPKIDGVVIRTVNFIRRLQARGDEILVLCPEMDGRRDCGVPIVEFPSFPFPAYPEYRIGIPNHRLPAALASFSPDVVHYVNPFAFGFRCYDFVERLGMSLPTVFSFHTLYGEYAKGYGPLKPLSRLLWWMMRDYHNRASANLTVSTIMQQDLIRRGFERVGFWPPAVDAELFHPDRANPQMRSRLSNGHPDKSLLLTVSRLATEKNVALLAEVLKRVPNAHLAIVGDGPQRAELEQRFQGLNASFVGYLTGEQLAAAYASADLFVFASETETMGNVVLEAMACGLPAIAPRAGGIPSLLADGESGMLYSPGNAAQAAEFVRHLLDDDASRRAMGQSARQRASGCSWDNAAEQLREFYRETISDHASRQLDGRSRHRLAPAFLTSLVYAYRTMASIRGKGPSRSAADLANNRRVPVPTDLGRPVKGKELVA
jgi:glycosyltransferase involved in cell wall biosynthesis